MVSSFGIGSHCRVRGGGRVACFLSKSAQSAMLFLINMARSEKGESNRVADARMYTLDGVITGAASAWRVR